MAPIEPSSHDEAQSQTALIRVLVVLVGVVVLVSLVFFLQSHSVESGNGGDGQAEGAGSQNLVQHAPEIPFSDVTLQSGVSFVHNSGARGEKLLPETMGGGVAFFDYDQDGDSDLLLVNGTWWPWDLENNPNLKPTTSRLYRNDTEPGGEWRFVDVTAGSGLDVPLYGMGVACGDYDNDGWVDVFVTAVGENKLFRNLGNGRFSDFTAQAGVGGDANAWSTSCTFFDYDHDGDLDLFVCNYVEWSRTLDLELNYQLAGIGRAYGPPLNFPGQHPYLYRNDGTNGFTDVSAQSGIQVTNRATGAPVAKSLGVSPVDVDRDGWVDLVVANDTVQNFVFRNRHNGTFEEVGAMSGVAYDQYGGTRGAMGIDAARMVEENQMAIAIGNFANEMTALYVTGTKPLLFSDEAMNEGIGAETRDALTFGVFFFDADLDGWLDLLTVNGHIENEIDLLQMDQSYRQSAQLFWNTRGINRKGGFVLLPEARTGADFRKPIVGRGAAYADVDHDGDLDVVMTQIDGRPMLLRNDLERNRSFLRLELTGTASNRDALGAELTLFTKERILYRHVAGTRGYLSQSELAVVVGLAEGDRPDSVEIRWPGNKKQKLSIQNDDTLVSVTEPHVP